YGPDSLHCSASGHLFSSQSSALNAASLTPSPTSTWGRPRSLWHIYFIFHVARPTSMRPKVSGGLRRRKKKAGSQMKSSLSLHVTARFLITTMACGPTAPRTALRNSSLLSNDRGVRSRRAIAHKSPTAHHG